MHSEVEIKCTVAEARNVALVFMSHTGTKGYVLQPHTKKKPPLT